MTERELLIQVMRRQGAVKVPSDIMLTPPKLEEFKKRVPDKTVEDYFHLSHRSIFAEYRPGYEGDGRELFGYAKLPENFSVDFFGVGEEKGSEAAFHMVYFHSPLAGESTTESRLGDHPLPILNPHWLEELPRRTAEIQNNGYAVLGFLEQTIWERAWLIRGMNDLMMDMISGDGRAHIILDRITEHSCITAGHYAAAGCDIIALGDDVGMQSSLMMSPDLWRSYLKPRLAQVIDTIRREKPDILVLYHSCGFVEPFIPDFIEIGIDILNPVQPESMEFSNLYKTYGNKISFWGGIGTQTTMPFGTPAEVQARTRELVAICGSQGGIVPCPTHVVEPEVPWKNLEAYRNAIEELN